MEEIRKFWKQGSFWVWIVIATGIIFIVIGAKSIFLPPIPWWGNLVVNLGIAIFLLVFLGKCFKQVGTIEIPCQAVLARFGKPVNAVGPGLHFVFWPIEKFKEFPTGQYTMTFQIVEGLYSKEDKKNKLSSQSMSVDIAIYLRFPRVDRDYHFPERIERTKEWWQKKLHEKMKREPSDSEVEEALRALDKEGLKEGLVWMEVNGKELLLRAYYRLPIKDLKKASVENLGMFFEKAVLGGVRHVMSSRNSLECREKKPEIEEELKNYLLTEEGDPFFECGIPKEGLAVEILKVKFPERIVEAWGHPEVARKRAEAAVQEKKEIETKLEAYIQKGVPEEIAALQVGGIEGKAMTFEQLRDLAIFLNLGGFQSKKKAH